MSQVNTAVTTRAQLEDERRRSAVECVRRLLHACCLGTADDCTRARIDLALSDLEHEWPHLALVARSYGLGETSFDALAYTWGVSNKTVIAEWREALLHLAQLLGYLP